MNPYPSVGMETQTFDFAVNNAFIGHACSHCREIAAFKGVQGKIRYPF